MAAEIPEPEIEQGFEDTQSIEDDINTLYKKFIEPIDRIRSIAEPPKGQNQTTQGKIENLNVDAIKKMESRAHAFYRMMGLPVVGGSSYYNPGYDPNPKSEQLRSSVAAKISDADRELMDAREQHPKLFMQMFAGQGFDTTAYGIVLSTPKTFNIIDDTEVVLYFRDFFINVSKAGLTPAMSDAITNGQISFIGRFGYPLTSVKHILKPFMVDPFIDHTVMPLNNKIAVPFLKDKQATKVSQDIFLDRPGIEFIIRARLKDNVPDKIFLANLEKTITKIKTPTTDVADELDINSLTETLQAFAGESEVKDLNLEEIFGGFSSTQAIVVKQLIKTIKVSIKLLSKATEDLAKIRESINGITFLPVSSTTGFETGGTNRDYTGTEEERNIAMLQIKQLYADRDAQIESGLGNFSTAQFINLEKATTLKEELEKKKETKAEQANTALKCLRTIEIITGEASGFGLVDILAVYTALWTIKIEDLLVLLDKDSVDRLYNFNVLLRSDAVNQRKNSAGNIQNALTSLEEKVVSILTFADKLYGESFSSVQAAEGGAPA